jgi:hypothetical protein
VSANLCCDIAACYALLQRLTPDGLLAMGLKTPRVVGFSALSLTTIASELAPTGSATKFRHSSHLTDLAKFHFCDGEPPKTL